MGMRVGSGGNSAAMAQMQVAQRAAAPSTTPAQQPVASTKDTQIQSILSLLSGTGGKVDLKA
jgi:hypothetical protein